MTKPNILQLAKQGDARAITSLLNRSLQPKGITAKAAQRDGVLHVLLEGELPPNQPASVRCIHQGLQKLGFVETPVTIYGRERGSAEVCWQSHLDAPLVGDAPDGEVSATPNGRFEQPGLNASAAFADPAVSPPTVADPGQEDGAEAPGAWDDFDFRSAGSDEATAIADNLDPGPNTGPHPSLDNIADSTTPGALGSSYGAPAASWNDSLVEDRFALDSPDEPTLIVPPQPDEELDSGLQDEDSDSEILLSLWDDADIDEDDMLESSQDDSGDALDLWQDGGSLDPMAGDPAASGNSPGLIGEPKAKRKGASLLPLLLLALLGMVGGAATASRLGMMRLPWLAKVPVVGPLLTPPDGASPAPGLTDGDDSSGEASGGEASGGEASGGEASGTSTSPSQAGTVDDSAAVEPAATEAEPTAATAPGAVVTESSPVTATASADSDAAPTPVAESSVTQSANADPFRDAVNAATQAAELAQIASSSEDWNIIAQHWTDAVDGMKAVSSDHPRYDVAQQKISEYQRNLDYALRLAAS